METIIEYALYLALGVTPIVLRSNGIGYDQNGRITRGGFALCSIPAVLILAFYVLR